MNIRTLSRLALLCALSACADDPASNDSRGGVILDPTHNAAAHLLPDYRGVVDRLELLDLSVVQPDGASDLYVGHPVELEARVLVEAEPFDAPLYFGLSSGDKHCLLGEVGIEHLTDYFDAAARANQAVASHAAAVSPGSLTDCSADPDACAQDEECVGVVGAVAPEGYDPDAALDAEVELPPEADVEGGEPPTLWQCMRPTYAANIVAASESAPLVITPADLTGSVELEYQLHGEAIVPEACAPLAGAADVVAWVSFDPDWLTSYPARIGSQDETHTDQDDPGATADVDFEVERETRAFAARETLNVSVGSLHADPGVDVELRHLTTGSAVVALHEDVVQPWDFEVNAELSVDGKLDAEHEAALATMTERFSFTLQPFGEPRADCSAEGVDRTAAALGIDDAEGHDHDAEVLDLHVERTVENHGFALHIAGPLRERVVAGDWSCWDRFEVEGCFTTDLDEADAPGLGTDNNCARLAIRVERVLPDPEAPNAVPKDDLPDQEEEFDFRTGALSTGGCNQDLLEEYTAQMKRYFELERSVKITNWYTMDYSRFLARTGVGDNWDYAPYNLPRGWFAGHIARSPWVGGHLYNCTQYFEQHGVVGGDQCWHINVINNDVQAYRRLRRYYLSDDGRGGDYIGFRADPFTHTNNWFQYMCQGIHSGTVFNSWSVDTLKSWWDRWRHDDPIHAQYDVTQRPTQTYLAGGSGGARCARSGLYMLQRYRIDEHGKFIAIADDGAFFSEYLPRIREKAAAKKRADEIWRQLVDSCTSVSTPAWSSEMIAQTRLAPALYPSKAVSFGSVNFGAEGGLLNDALVNKVTGEFVLTAGPQVRLWVDGMLAPQLGGGIELRLYDLFRAWILGRFYSDVVSSHISAGFHVLTYDLWKLKYKLPDQFLIPMPPPIEKEKERCRSFFYAPIPVGVELCAGIGGALGIKGDGPNDEATLTVEKVGTTAGSEGRPGIVGRVIPFIAIKSSGSIGLDFLAGVAGFKLHLDPTVELQFPIEPSLHWDLRWQSASSRIAWELVPGIRIGFDVIGFGGNLDFELDWRFGDTLAYTIVDWDPLDLASETLFERSWLFSGETQF